jgi:carbonic anhydrase
VNFSAKVLPRRQLVKLLGAAGAGVGLATTTACAQTNTQGTSAPVSVATTPSPETTTNAANESRPNTMKPDEALKMLTEGNKRFASGQSANPRHSFARVQDTAVDEFPFAAVLSSADSRVSPEIVFDQGIGDLYVTRVFGFVATPEVIESMEYAVGVLKVPLIVVMGSAREPAVQAVLREQSSVLGKMDRLAPAIEPAVDPHRGKVDGSDLSASIKGNMKRQADRLKQSPVLAKAIQEDSLKIVAAYYDLDSASVEIEES